MARSIHKPWLKLWVQGILNENNNNDSTTNENISIINSNNRNKNNQNSTITTTRSSNHHKNVSDIVNKNYIPRIVQVMSCNEEARCMLISDTEYCIHVFFKKDIFESILNDYNIDSLKYSLIKISNYHLSTVIQSSGNIDIKKLQQLKVTYPLSIFCSKITFLGASECEIINRPTALNLSHAIRMILRKYEYYNLVMKLGYEQFPREGCLPSWGKLVNVVIIVLVCKERADAIVIIDIDIIIM